MARCGLQGAPSPTANTAAECSCRGSYRQQGRFREEKTTGGHNKMMSWLGKSPAEGGSGWESVSEKSLPHETTPSIKDEVPAERGHGPNGTGCSHTYPMEPSTRSWVLPGPFQQKGWI